MLNSVAALVLDGVAPFELGVLAEVFGTDRTADGLPGYRFDVCSPQGATVRTSAGFQLVPSADLGPIERADLVAVPAHHGDTTTLPEVHAALRRAADRGAYLFSVCTGAYLLGEAGLLDGRECTTHWRHVDELQRRHPEARVRCNSLYVQDGRLLTSAGTAAGIDACLHLVRQEHGSATATRLARRMVVPPHRDGGQSQYVEAPIAKVPQAPTLEPLLEWLIQRLDQQVTVDELAARVGMAPRTFARRFRAETGTTPHDWVTNQRVLLARRLLEETGLTVDEVADRTGFGNAAALRHHFTRRVGATPNAYRVTFRDRVPAD
ncbi:GlxA family transcriptional regulator [Micromonospora maris]|uniref:GlxA family transcriptional regulator n=1 Tax=Micromonospora maris TaxID=1003110 RepID=UPI002E11F6D8|nr:helix-turn-helix domain-containing protein [Micromonospora maris]WSK42927.1 helix-turn-helix domain-containing protein [Micromonospora maris]